MTRAPLRHPSRFRKALSSPPATAAVRRPSPPEIRVRRGPRGREPARSGFPFDNDFRAEVFMRTARVVCACAAFCVCTGLAASAAAQQPANPAAAQALRAEIDQLKKRFSARLAALEAKLAAMTGETPAAPAAPPPRPAAAARRTANGGGAAGRGGRRRTQRLAAGLRQRQRRVEDLQPRHRRDRQFPRRRRQRTTSAPSRRWRCTRPKRRSRRSSIPTRAPTSSWPSPRRASSSRKASSPSRRCPAGCC